MNNRRLGLASISPRLVADVAKATATTANSHANTSDEEHYHQIIVYRLLGSTFISFSLEQSTPSPLAQGLLLLGLIDRTPSPIYSSLRLVYALLVSEGCKYPKGQRVDYILGPSPSTRA